MATCSSGSSSASESSDNHDNNEAITIADTYSANFTWRIKRCGYLSDAITCEAFQSYSDSRPEESDPVLWQLKFYSGLYYNSYAELGLTIKDKEAVSTAFGDALRVSMTISVGSGDKPTNIVNNKKIMFSPMDIICSNTHYRNEIKMALFKYDDVNVQDVLDNELVITFALVHSGSKIVTASHNCNIDEARAGKLRTVGHLQGIYDDRYLTDAEIEVGGETIRVHRIILSMMSKVFKTLFDGDFNEGNTSKVCIDDMTPEACKIMLGHIYGKPLPDVTSFEDITQLLHAAEKYELDGLKAICGQRMCSSLCTERACCYYIMSDRYRVDALKACCKSYIKFHKRDVVKSEGWEKLQADHPQLVQELSQTP